MHGSQPEWNFMAGAPRPINAKAHPPQRGERRAQTEGDRANAAGPGRRGALSGRRSRCTPCP
jgi:hypothetical protein